MIIHETNKLKLDLIVGYCNWEVDFTLITLPFNRWTVEVTPLMRIVKYQSILLRSVKF